MGLQIEIAIHQRLKELMVHDEGRTRMQHIERLLQDRQRTILAGDDQSNNDGKGKIVR